MATEHIVRQGETVARIASQYGFADWHPVWQSDANSHLVKLRGNPDVLAAGDRIVIPDRTDRVELGATGRRHTFQLVNSPLKLRLVIRDFDNEPLRGIKVVLSIEGRDLDLRTDNDGLIETEIPVTAERGELRFTNPQAPFDLTIPLRIGHLDPVSELSGQAARLNNLGYGAGTGKGDDAIRFEMAVQEFQADQGLPVDGVCSPRTRAKLEEIYGS